MIDFIKWWTEKDGRLLIAVILVGLLALGIMTALVFGVIAIFN